MPTLRIFTRLIIIIYNYYHFPCPMTDRALCHRNLRFFSEAIVKPLRLTIQTREKYQQISGVHIKKGTAIQGEHQLFCYVLATNKFQSRGEKKRMNLEPTAHAVNAMYSCGLWSMSLKILCSSSPLTHLQSVGTASLRRIF